MDDLRWILLLAGIAVLVAIYFSSRFEGEDWARERKQSRTGGRGKTGEKAGKKSKSLGRSVRSAVKKEPRMGLTEPDPKPITEKPDLRHESGDASPSAGVDAPEDKPVIEPAAKTNQKVSVDVEYSGIEDEITGIEIPEDLAVAEAEIHIAGAEQDATLEQATMPPGIEPLVLSVSIFADEEAGFSGLEIKEALEAEGLLYGAMRIFHFHDSGAHDVSENNDDAVFSVASVLEPGFFDLEKLDGMKTPGLMLFCQLPGPLAGTDALEVMLDKGRGLAVRLHGYMCDDKRNRFTAQAKNHYLDRIAAFNRKLVLARKKTSTN